MSYWVDDFWIDGFWVDNFWLGLTSGGPVVSTPQTKGGYVPPTYKRGKLKKKDESILNQINELIERLEKAPVILPQKVANKAREVKEITEQVVNIKEVSDHSRRLTNVQAQLNRLEITVNKAIIESRNDEEAAIKALLTIL